MPNHVINELIFKADQKLQDDLCKSICGPDGRVDFGVLVPLPKNIWWGNVGAKHEKAFRHTALDWSVQNWGTKWNAYDHHDIVAAPDQIIFRFQTAWSPPYPWLAAVFNTFNVSFEHNWLSEGHSVGVHGLFSVPEKEKDWTHEHWAETELEESSALHRHLHKLLWGVEEFADEEGK